MLHVLNSTVQMRPLRFPDMDSSCRDQMIRGVLPG
jgi:hypothetical protein